MLHCGFLILLHACTRSWLKSKWRQNKESILQLRGSLSKLKPIRCGNEPSVSQEIQAVSLGSSRGNEPLCNTLSGTTWVASDLHPCRWQLIFINLINFEDEFIAVDKIANYRPQQNSLGSKLVLYGQRAQGAMRGLGATVCYSPVRQRLRQQRKWSLFSYGMKWTWEMDTCRSGRHSPPTLELQSVVLPCSPGT